MTLTIGLTELSFPAQILIIAISVLFIAGLFLLIRALAEPYMLDISKVSLKPSKQEDGVRKQKRAEYINAASDNNPDLRLIFFSDLHANLCRVPHEKLTDCIKKANKERKVDAVVFGGDIVDDDDKPEVGIEYLRQIASVCRELDIPFYGITGNHDTGLDPSSGKLGFESIEGRFVEFKSHKSAKTISISGVDDSGRYKRTWYKIPKVPEDHVNILFAHNPDAILHLGEDEHPDFMISGHIHGGQVKLPFRLEYVGAIRDDKLPRKGIIEGSFCYNGITLFISRGLGCGSLPIRLSSKPEVDILDFYI